MKSSAKNLIIIVLGLIIFNLNYSKADNNMRLLNVTGLNNNFNLHNLDLRLRLLITKPFTTP